MSLSNSVNDDNPTSPLIPTKDYSYEEDDSHEGSGRRCVPWTKDFFPWVKCRVVVTVMVFLGMCNVYALRVNLSMAIVVMANNTAKTGHQHYKTIGKPEIYNWSETEQGWLLGAFFCGYILTQVPGGLLAQKFGAKYVYGTGVFMTAVLTLLTPVAAELSVWAVLVVRALEGFFEGVTFPSAHALFGVWAPPAERSRMLSFAYSGQFLGSFISFPLTAILCVYGFDGGWPSAFYIFGIIGIIWFIFWLLLVYSSPATHPRISQEERNYIERSIAESKQQSTVTVPIPWLQIFGSPVLWGVIVAHFCNCYGFFILLTMMPTYFAQALGFKLGNDLIMNGVYSSITYVVQLVIGVLAGPMADILIAKCFSTTVTRKLFTCSALVLNALFLLLAGYFGNIRSLAIVLVILGNGLTSLNLSGYHVNSIELSPRFSGVLMGIVNTAGTLPGIIGPVIAKAIAHSHNAPRSVYIEEWREVFIIAAEVYLFGAAIYAILGDSKKQWWADGVNTKNRRFI